MCVCVVGLFAGGADSGVSGREQEEREGKHLITLLYIKQLAHYAFSMTYVRIVL